MSAAPALGLYGGFVSDDCVVFVVVVPGSTTHRITVEPCPAEECASPTKDDAVVIFTGGVVACRPSYSDRVELMPGRVLSSVPIDYGPLEAIIPALESHRLRTTP